MSKSLQKRIQVRFPKLKVLVVGDAMLDEYWFGDSTRISPEAPVPITKIAHKTSTWEARPMSPLMLQA